MIFVSKRILNTYHFNGNKCSCHANWLIRKTNINILWIVSTSRSIFFIHKQIMLIWSPDQRMNQIFIFYPNFANVSTTYGRTDKEFFITCIARRQLRQIKFTSICINKQTNMSFNIF